MFKIFQSQLDINENFKSYVAYDTADQENDKFLQY